MSSAVLNPPLAPPVLAPAPAAAVPPVSQAPAPPPAAAPAARPQMPGTAADRMEQKIKSFLQTHVVTPPPVPLTPDAPAPPANAAPLVTPPASDAPPAAASPVEVDLEAIDFDAPVTEAAPAAHDANAAPALSEKEAYQQLQAKIEAGDLDGIEAAFLRTPKGKAQLETWKSMRELRKPAEEGGIGRIPTVDEIKEAESARHDLMAMRHDFITNPASFAANIFTINPQTGRSYFGGPEETAKVLSSLPETIIQNAQRDQRLLPLANAISFPIFKMFFDTQYQRALAMPADSAPNQEMKARTLDALRMGEFLALGETRTLPGIDVPAAGGSDPRIQALESQLQQMRNQVSQQATSRTSTLVSQAESMARSNTMADVDKVLARTGLDKVYPSELLDPLRQRIYDQVEALVTGKNGVTHDRGGLQTYQIQLDEMTRSQSPDPSKPSETKRRLFRNALQTNPEIKGLLTKLVQAAKTTTDTRNGAGLPAQDRVEPSGGGVPAPASVVPQKLERQPNESTTDYNARRLSNSLRAAGATR